MQAPVNDHLAIQELSQRHALYEDTDRLDALMALLVDDLMFDEARIGAPSLTARPSSPRPTTRRSSTSTRRIAA